MPNARWREGLLTGHIRFGTDGWRSVIADGFTFANVARVAQAIADWLAGEGYQRSNGIIVGYDTRFLSPQFAAVAAGVLAANGWKTLVVDRPSPTPAVSWAIRRHGLAGGIMITASHNPPEYNGLKLKASFGGPALPVMTAAVEALLMENQRQGRVPRHLDPGEARRRGLWVNFDPMPDYLRQLEQYVDLAGIGRAGFKVVLDSMHGAGYGYLSRILVPAGVDVIEIRKEPRPDFAGIPPEPIARNLRPARAAVIAEAADAAICVDGDADRIAAVDTDGQVVDAHRVFALLLRHLYETRGKAGSVVKTFAGSRMIQLLAQLYGLPYYETPVGFKHVVELALREPVLIGGEESGGIGVGDHMPERDGMLCGLLLLEMMAARNQPLRDLVADLLQFVGPHYFDRVDLALSPQAQAGLMQRLAADPPQAIAGMPVEDVDQTDGVKLLLGSHGWILFRASGTEPVVRIYAEADHPQKVADLVAAGTSLARAGCQGQP